MRPNSLQMGGHTVDRKRLYNYKEIVWMSSNWANHGHFNWHPRESQRKTEHFTDGFCVDKMLTRLNFIFTTIRLWRKDDRMASERRRWTRLRQGATAARDWGDGSTWFGCDGGTCFQCATMVMQPSDPSSPMSIITNFSWLLYIWTQSLRILKVRVYQNVAFFLSILN